MGVDMVASELWFERADNRWPTRSNAAKFNLIPKRTHHEYRRNFFSSSYCESVQTPVQAPHSGIGDPRQDGVKKKRRRGHTA